MQEYAKTYDDVKKPRVQVHSTLGPLLWEQPQSPCLHPLCEHWLKSKLSSLASDFIRPDTTRPLTVRISLWDEQKQLHGRNPNHDILHWRRWYPSYRRTPFPTARCKKYLHPPIGCSVIHQTNWDGHEFLKCENRARARLDTLTL